jgi:hypothetical protein
MLTRFSNAVDSSPSKAQRRANKTIHTYEKTKRSSKESCLVNEQIISLKQNKN